MSGVNAFNVGIFLLNTIAYSIAVASTTVTYKKYHYNGHLWMLFGFIFLFFAAFSRFLVELVSENSIFFMWFLANLFLMIGIWALFMALMYSQYDRLPKRTHFISILVGILIGLFANKDFVQLKEDKFFYNASYSPIIGIFSVILLFIFVLHFIRPMTLKTRKEKSDWKQIPIFILFTSHILLIFWVLSITLTQNFMIRIARPATFAIAMLLWAIALYLNPLMLSISYTKVKQFIVLTVAGLPLFSYDFTQNQELKTELLTAQLAAFKETFEFFWGSKSTLTSMIFQDAIVSFVSQKQTIIIFFTQGLFSSNLELLGRVFLDNFERKHKENLDTGIISINEFKSDFFHLINQIQSVTI